MVYIEQVGGGIISKKINLSTPIFFFGILMIVLFAYHRNNMNHYTENDYPSDSIGLYSFLSGGNHPIDLVLDDDERIRNHLLNSGLYAQKPVMWIMIEKEFNTRDWRHFHERTQTSMNMPFVLLTLRSIIQHNANDFTICIINEDSFERILPDWRVKISELANPIRSNMCELAKTRLLYTYGGMMVPMSFLCVRSMRGLYDNGVSNKGMFLVNTRGKSVKDYDVMPDGVWMGCKKKSNRMKEMILFMEVFTSYDYTSESEFLSRFSEYCMGLENEDRINVIDSKYIGVKTNRNKLIGIEDLMSNKYIGLDKSSYGMYIPWREITSRPKYDWFARLDSEGVLRSNTAVGNWLMQSYMNKNT